MKKFKERMMITMTVIFKSATNGCTISTKENMKCIPNTGDIVLIKKANESEPYPYKVLQKIIDTTPFHGENCYIFVNKVTINDYCLSNFI